MISEKMQKQLSDQINKEMYSAYLYLSMSSWCTENDLNGLANWFRIQYQEEMGHAFKIYDYVLEQDGRVDLLAIDRPPHDFKSAQAIFEDTLEHERKVTSLIHKLVDLAVSEKDYATQNFLQWFVNEQVEEEAAAKGILQEIRLIGGQGPGLFMINRELGQRVFTPPPQDEKG